MSKPKFLSPYWLWRCSCRNACLFSIGLALATVTCIGIGVCLHQCSNAEPPIGGTELFSDALYEAAQVMVLNMDPHPRSNGWITAGRILAVLLVLFLGIQALGKLLGESWHNFRLIWYRRHNLVCGLGRIGWQLVQDLIQDGKRVVVIEQDPANERCLEAQRLGAVVLMGDATNDEILRHARLPKARAVYVVTGSDEKNIAAAVDVQRLAHQNGAARRPDCYVHILAPALTEVLRNSLRTDADGAMKVTAFNVMHNTVRNLIVKHLTPVRPSQPEQVALYVVIGFGLMGQALAAHLAELAHFENRKRVRLLILAEDAPAAADAFLSRWGQFSPRVVVDKWTQIAFDPAADAWSCRTQRPGPAYQVDNAEAIEYACNAVFAPLPPYIAERGFLNALVSLLRQPGVKPALIVCTDREQENYTTAVTLEQSLLQTHGLSAPVFVWLPKQEPLQRLLTGKGGAVTPFGSCRDELRLQNVTDPLEEKLALAILRGFHQLADEQKVLQLWENDTEVFRHSNRSAATHALVRLGCLGLKLVEPDALKEGPVTELTATEEEIKTLAQMEHNRWVAERLLAGFSYGKKSDQPPRREQLCTWDALSNNDLLKQEPAKDFNQIQTVFETLRKLKYTFVRA